LRPKQHNRLHRHLHDREQWPGNMRR